MTTRFGMFFPHVCGCQTEPELKEDQCKYIGRMDSHRGYWLYMFNCPHCKTTFCKKSGDDL